MTFISTKSSTKKFHLVSKYDTYCIWDGQQNAPYKMNIDELDKKIDKTIGKFVKKNTQALIIAVGVVVAAIILSSSGMFRSSQDDCYYKVYKHYKLKGKSEEYAARWAREDCK